MPAQEMILALVGVGVTTAIGLVGWLLRRAIGELDTKVTSMQSDMKENTKKVDGLEKEQAVHKWRLDRLDGGTGAKQP